jgi:hypothetical protein
VAAWATRRTNRQQFERDLIAKRRDDLRAVADAAARLLAVGATNVRLIREARDQRTQEPGEVRDWASNVHALEQRLLLRVPTTSSVATSYRAVRQALLQLDGPGGEPLEDAISHFEAARTDFLIAVRGALEAPISST